MSQLYISLGITKVTFPNRHRVPVHLSLVDRKPSLIDTSLLLNDKLLATMDLLSLVSTSLLVSLALTLSLSRSLSYVKIPHAPQESIDALAAILARLLFTIKGFGRLPLMNIFSDPVNRGY